MKTDELLKNFLKDKKCTIVDTHASARAGLARTMIDLGVKPSHITLCSSFDHAVKVIEDKRTEIVVSDFELDNRCGLDLIQIQKQYFEESKETLFVLVTANTSQSAVAESAEEDVDAYIIKPYTLDYFKHILIKTVRAKLHPSPYFLKIEEGKDFFDSKDYVQAIESFVEAMNLSKKPSLACYYEGNTYRETEKPIRAEGSYRKGLDYNKIHHKCSIGLFDILMDQGKYHEAYRVVKKLSKVFPANPQRLSSIVHLAVRTEQYQDMEAYHEIFKNMDFRDEKLKKYMCAGLVVSGKHYLRDGDITQCLKLFAKAAVSSGGDFELLSDVIVFLVEERKPKAALPFLNRIDPTYRNTPKYLALKLFVEVKVARYDHQPIGPFLERGRQLVIRGNHDPLLYVVMVDCLQQEGKMRQAKSFLEQAMKHYPDQETRFLKLVGEETDSDLSPDPIKDLDESA